MTELATVSLIAIFFFAVLFFIVHYIIEKIKEQEKQILNLSEEVWYLNLSKDDLKRGLDLFKFETEHPPKFKVGDPVAQGFVVGVFTNQIERELAEVCPPELQWIYHVYYSETASIKEIPESRINESTNPESTKK